MDQNVTLKKIAELTGFSVITVSRAISNPNKVKEATRNKILAACEQMNYSPNMVARSLKENKTRIISVYIPEDIKARNPFYTIFVSSVAEALGAHKYSMLLTTSLTITSKCDGMLLTALSDKDIDTAHRLDSQLPVVLFGHMEGIDSIDVDNKQGLAYITNKVIDRGAKNITYLSIDQDRIFVFDREYGMSSTSENRKVNYLIHRVKNNSFETYLYLKKNFKKMKGTDAFVCASDDIALGAINFLQEKGYSVPEDIQVCGYDGFGSESHSIPAIATMKQPIYEIGHMLVERLIEKIEKKDRGSKTQLVKPTFIDNGSLRKGE